MQIGGVMRTQLVTSRPDQTASEAIRTMLDAGVGSVLLLEDRSSSGSSRNATYCVSPVRARRLERCCSAT